VIYLYKLGLLAWMNKLTDTFRSRVFRSHTSQNVKNQIVGQLYVCVQGLQFVSSLIILCAQTY